MKKDFSRTLTTLILCICIVFNLIACGEFTQDDIDSAVNDAITPLNAQIAALKSENESLKSDKAELETKKGTLEDTLAAKEIELACAKDEHVWDGESEVEYVWSNETANCTVVFDCMHCEEKGRIISKSVSTDENGNLVASFDGAFPNDTYYSAIVTGVTFNTDSEGYDEATKTFTVSADHPFVLTITGNNLDQLSKDNDYILTVNRTESWHILDYIYDSMYHLATIEKDRITYTMDWDFVTKAIAAYNSINGFLLFDANSENAIMTSMVNVKLVPKVLEVDPNGYTVVTHVAEFEAAVKNGGKIKLGADIERENGFNFKEDVVIDLAGYDIRVTLESHPTCWCFANVELKDSVGGSKLYNNILVNGGNLKISGDINFENVDTPLTGSGKLDLSEYMGEEIYLVTENFDEIILSEGYAFYSHSTGEKLADFEAAKEEDHVYVRPA